MLGFKLIHTIKRAPRPAKYTIYPINYGQDFVVRLSLVVTLLRDLFSCILQLCITATRATIWLTRLRGVGQKVPFVKFWVTDIFCLSKMPIWFSLSQFYIWRVSSAVRLVKHETYVYYLRLGHISCCHRTVAVRFCSLRFVNVIFEIKIMKSCGLR